MEFTKQKPKAMCLVCGKVEEVFPTNLFSFLSLELCRKCHQSLMAKRLEVRELYHRLLQAKEDIVEEVLAIWDYTEGIEEKEKETIVRSYVPIFLLASSINSPLMMKVSVIDSYESATGKRIQERLKEAIEECASEGKTQDIEVARTLFSLDRLSGATCCAFAKVVLRQ